MKQRLAIAAALLPDPELLILDEPTNGLDPAGIVEMRSLLIDLGSQGRTLMVSSHLLSEIEAACTRVIVIGFGEMLFSGPLSELTTRTSAHVRLAPELDRDAARLAEILHVHGYKVHRTNGDLLVDAGAAAAAEVNRIAAQGGITLRMLSAHEETLEEVFLRMTGATDGDNAHIRSDQRGRRRRRLPGRRSSTGKEAAHA